MKKLGIWFGLLLVMLLPVRASAAQMQEILIPVTVLTEGNVPDTPYTVELVPLTPGCPMPEGSSGNSCRIELKNSGSFCICCDRLGVFDYQIRQVPGEAPECTWDESVYRLRLAVTVQEDGSTAVSALIYGQEETKQPAAVFRNYWARPVQIQLSALKTLDGRTPEDGAFSFRLISEDGEILHEVKNVGRNVIFPVMEFQQEGTYRYFLKEVKGDAKKILYDRTVYTIIVEVTLDGDYRARVSYERNGKPYSGTPSFANYTDTGSPKTGDTIGRAFAVLMFSTAGLAGIYLCKRKKS